ncbi:MAG: PAS domain S-box protein [Deltaproteobacteria bacterium]|nr:PAS domain S-box protein [Deltaproteobacteria bacterium]
MNEKPSYEDLEQRIKILEEEISKSKQTKKILKETETRYKLIMDNVRDTIWLMDMNMRTIWISPSVERQRGFTLEELNSLPLERHLTPESFRVAVTLMEQNLSPERLADPMEKITGSAEMEFYRKDGSTFWADTVLTLIRDEQGLPSGFLGLSRDTTERKMVEEAIRSSEEKFRALSESSTVAIFLIQGTKYIYINPAFEKNLGYTMEDLADMNFWEIIHPDMRQIVKERGMGRLKGEAPPSSYEIKVITKNGDVRWANFSATLIMMDSKPTIIGSTFDITDRKKMEEELRESRQQLSNIIEFLPDATFVIDRDEKVIAWNRAIEAMTGVRKEEMLGKGNREYALPFYGDRSPTLVDIALHPELMSARQGSATIRRMGDVFFGEGYTPKLPQGERHLSATASVFHDSRGAVVAAIECIRDITESKKLEERLRRSEKMEALGQLAGGVAHDLNNVLGILVGYSELLAETLPEESAQKKYALNIHQSGLRGAAIIQDLLTLARRGVVTSDVVDLNRIISDYLRTPEFETLRSYHPEVRVRTELANDLLKIKGSPVHLNKTVMNLVSNAAEAISGAGEVTLRTENRYVDRPLRGYDNIQEGDYVVVTISDSGIGIPVRDLGMIFEPFYTKKVMGRSGTGLGLAVVWGTVRDHEGYIDVQSQEGKGTTFTLYFPVTWEDELAKASEAPSPSIYQGKGETILVVDDVEAQRVLATTMLCRLGYQVNVASCGEEAVEYLKRNKADLVVLDMIMDPGMDGMETYRKILGIYPKQKAILVSGFSETGRVKEAQKLGAGSFVRKPYILESIGMAVRGELDR